MSGKRQREVSAEEPENLDGQDGASQGPTAKKQKSPTPEPPSSTQPRVAQQAVEDDEETDEGDETDEDAEVVQRPSWAFDDEDDDDDDDDWPRTEEDRELLFEICRRQIQAGADRLREEIRVALCNGMVWKPSCVNGNASVIVGAKVEHYQFANWAFGGSEDDPGDEWAAMDYPIEDFNENFGPIHNVTGSTPLALTGTHVRVFLYQSMDEPLRENMTVTVSASYGTHEARDRLQDTDVYPSDLEDIMSEFDDDSSFSEDSDREEAHRGETEETEELDPAVH